MKTLLRSERDVLELPFDQYQRYRLVADLLRQLAERRGALDILDVGGRTGLLREFLPDQRIELVDLEPSDVPGLVLGDGSRLPFRDGAFDAVTACDTLEHVPPRRRERFVRECARVSRGWVVLAGPYREPRVDEAEEALRSFLGSKLELRHRYLEEHRSHGLPEREGVEALLGEALGNVASHGHGNIERWLLLMSISMYMEGDPHLQRVARRYYRFYNRALYPTDDGGDVYRHAVVGYAPGYPAPRFELLSHAGDGQARDGQARNGQAGGGGARKNGSRPALEAGQGLDGAARIPRTGEPAAHLDPQLSAATLGPLRELLDELVPFDREREVYEAERERLLAVNGGLERDLAGHRARLAELESIAGERATVIETLERDLDGHRDCLRAIGEEFDALRLELEARQAAHERVLSEHRAVIDGLQAGAEQLERELAARVAHQAELEAELQSVHQLASQVHEELLREHRAAEALRAELRSRKQNLRRALSLRKPAI